MNFVYINLEFKQEISMRCILDHKEWYRPSVSISVKYSQLLDIVNRQEDFKLYVKKFGGKDIYTTIPIETDANWVLFQIRLTLPDDWPFSTLDLFFFDYTNIYTHTNFPLFNNSLMHTHVYSYQKKAKTYLEILFPYHLLVRSKLF